MNNLPYVTGYGNVSKALKKIREAATPERVSQDFVKTVLGISGGSGDQMTSFLKKVGFADSTGLPTDIYKKFRSNDLASKQACAEAIRFGYKPLFVKNEYCYKLKDEELKGLIVEVTGQAADSTSVLYAFNCFKNMRIFADFEQGVNSIAQLSKVDDTDQNDSSNRSHRDENFQGKQVGLRLSYTINLNLPATSDVSVFNAIFKSLKENLLKD
jgi:Family of unknown function (DUF5343)